METIIIEIRSAEGGDDAKDLVRVQCGVFAARALLKCL